MAPGIAVGCQVAVHLHHMQSANYISHAAPLTLCLRALHTRPVCHHPLKGPAYIPWHAWKVQERPFQALSVMMLRVPDKT